MTNVTFPLLLSVWSSTVKPLVLGLLAVPLSLSALAQSVHTRFDLDREAMREDVGPLALSRTPADPPLWGLTPIDEPENPASFSPPEVASVDSCPANVTLNLPANFSWLACNYLSPLGSNTVANLLPSPAHGTVLYKWDPVLTGWAANVFNVTWSNPLMTPLPGEGVAIFSASAQTVGFTGTKPPHPPSSQPPMPSGWYLVGGRSACANSFEEFMGSKPMEWDQVIIPRNGATSLEEPPVAPILASAYVGGVWNAGVPTLQPGQAAWVQRVLPMPLRIVLVGKTVQIYWDPRWGDLYTKSNVSGAWVKLEVSVSPYTTEVTQSQQYFTQRVDANVDVLVPGQPIPGSGITGCCGSYIGRVVYAKGGFPNWGWQPIPGAPRYRATACVSSAGIVWTSSTGKSGCATNFIDVPCNPNVQYRFGVYFKVPPVPQSCTLNLEGFFQ